MTNIPSSGAGAAANIPNQNFNLFKDSAGGAIGKHGSVVSMLLAEFQQILAKLEASLSNKANSVKELAQIKNKINELQQAENQLTTKPLPKGLGQKIADDIGAIKAMIAKLPDVNVNGSEAFQLNGMIGMIGKMMDNPLAGTYTDTLKDFQAFLDYFHNLMSKDHWDYSVNAFAKIVCALKKDTAGLGKMMQLFKDAGIPIPPALSNMVNEVKNMWKKFGNIKTYDNDKWVSFNDIFGDKTDPSKISHGALKHMLHVLFALNNEHGTWDNLKYHFLYAEQGRSSFWSGNNPHGDNDIWKAMEKMENVNNHPPVLTPDQIAELISAMTGGSKDNIENREALPNLWKNYLTALTTTGQLMGGVGTLSNTTVVEMQAELTLLQKLQKMLEKEVMQPTQVVNAAIKRILKQAVH